MNHAPSIGTKGHFYELDPVLKDRLPVLVDHAGNIIEANKTADDTWLGVEKYSGVTLQARERIQINFIIELNKTDNLTLFSHLEEGYVFPFVFVRRDSIMSDDEVSQILGTLITAAELRIPLLVTFLVLGFVLALVGCCLVKRLRTLQKRDGSYDHMKRQKLIDETTFKNGIGNKRFSSVKSSKSARSKNSQGPQNAATMGTQRVTSMTNFEDDESITSYHLKGAGALKT